METSVRREYPAIGPIQGGYWIVRMYVLYTYVTGEVSATPTCIQLGCNTGYCHYKPYLQEFMLY